MKLSWCRRPESAPRLLASSKASRADLAAVVAKLDAQVAELRTVTAELRALTAEAVRKDGLDGQ